jgi:GNAT superfamily N-acetyltransferase
LSQNQLQVFTARFEEVLPIWQMELWPGRTSAIEPQSAMTWLGRNGGIDMSLMSASPTFFIAKTDTRIVGVLSGHFGGLIEQSPGNGVQERAYRTRGLWVQSESRRQGVAQALMKAAFLQARTENCALVWTFPRQSSMNFYRAMGFHQEGEWHTGEFGPNCYAIARLSTSGD